MWAIGDLVDKACTEGGIDREDMRPQTPRV